MGLSLIILVFIILLLFGIYKVILYKNKIVRSCGSSSSNIDLNIFDIPVYYISFNRDLDLESNIMSFGFKNVSLFNAVDGRKYKLSELRDDNIISIRSYNDLLYGRKEHSGMPSLGAVGCTLSHYNLWKKCVDDNLPYIIVCEDDVKIFDIDSCDIDNIKSVVSKDKGCFISANIDKNTGHFQGTQFYIASNSACRELVKYAFPIDVQTDYYMAHLGSLGKINLSGYRFIGQTHHKSSIQDFCIKCFLPNSKRFYFSCFLFLLFITFFVIFYIIYVRRSGNSRCISYIKEKCGDVCKI